MQNARSDRRQWSAQWGRWRRVLAGRPLPAALIDLDALEVNIERLIAPARATEKRIRIATKSLRCPSLVRRIAARLGDRVAGLMTYSAVESAFWAREPATPGGEAMRDLLLAYPTLQPSDLSAILDANREARCSVVVDDPAQVDPLAAAARSAGLEVPLVIEVDVAWRPFGRTLHIGVRRSPLRAVDDVVALAQRIAATDGVRFAGVMGYEAQIAGLTDSSPLHAAQNRARRAVKRLSRRDVESVRSTVVRALTDGGLAPSLVNGGGTGSVGWSSAEEALTEITLGSGFLGAHLFDGYADLALEPAALFALQTVRRPGPGLVTCHGGGFVASGDGGRDRLPLPWLPAGARLLGLEGAGEVQTPIALPKGVEVELGDPILFRHAKAGELAEHFAEYLLVQGETIVEIAPTYRGLGHCFLG